MPDLQALLDEVERMAAADDATVATMEANGIYPDEYLQEVAPQLAKALQAVLAKCASMERGVGYRVSGQHDTWDSYHEGMSDMAGYIEEAITDAIGADQ